MHTGIKDIKMELKIPAKFHEVSLSWTGFLSTAVEMCVFRCMQKTSLKEYYYENQRCSTIEEIIFICIIVMFWPLCTAQSCAQHSWYVTDLCDPFLLCAQYSVK
jgi:hypothetical protein